MFFYTSVKVYWCGFIYCMCVWMRVWYLKPWKIFSNHCSAGFSLFCEAVCYSARLTVLSIPSAVSQPASPCAIVFLSRVSALCTACHACPPDSGVRLG